MILWISGIIEAEVNPAFFATMNFVQPRLDAIAAIINVGNAVEKIRVVFIVNRDPITEYRRFSKKDKTLDARVRVDYEEFRTSSEEHRIEMFVNSLITVLQETDNFDAVQFNKSSLIESIKSISKSNQ